MNELELRLRHLWRVLCRSTLQWIDHEGARLAASLSLYSVLSLAPLVILAIATASLAFGRPAAQQALLSQVRDLMGSDGASAVQAVIQYGRTPHMDRVASVIGILTLLFGASSVFAELQSALNKIWEVPAPVGTGFYAIAKSRLFSFALVLGIGFLLLVSLLISTALSALGHYFGTLLPAPTWARSVLNLLLSFLGISVVIALILRYVPDTKVSWRAAMQGSVATALLFTIGKSLLGLYLGKAAVGSAYGAADSLVVVILWVYYSAMIFYFGAEFTHVRSLELQASARANPGHGIETTETRQARRP